MRSRIKGEADGLSASDRKELDRHVEDIGGYKVIGKGSITERRRITSNVLNSSDIQKHDRVIEILGGYVDPKEDLAAWLGRYEQWLARCAKLNGLPTRATAIVFFDAENRSNWCPGTDGRGKTGDGYPISSNPDLSDRFKNPQWQLAMHYLRFDEDGDKHCDGRSWGEQTVRWYVGEQMYLAWLCRDDLKKNPGVFSLAVASNSAAWRASSN